MLAADCGYQEKLPTLFWLVSDAGESHSHDQWRPNVAGLSAGLVAEMVALK